MNRVAIRRNGRWQAAAAAVTWTLGIAVVASDSFGGEAEKPGAAAPVERLIKAACQAELDGDASRHFALLREAVREAPDYQLTRWQLGQVQVAGEWLAVEEAQRRAAADKRQAEYRERRVAGGESFEGQLALAKWCRKNGLAEEALFHWANVLSVDPEHNEALRAVGRRWYSGRLLTPDEIETFRRESRTSQRAAQRWGGSIGKWDRALAGDEKTERDAALEEIRSLNSLDAIPALEEVTLSGKTSKSSQMERRRVISLAFLQAMDAMPEQAATESLTRHAVLSVLAEVRADATYKLKKRALHDFVPLLLSGLTSPIESWYRVTTASDGSVHYRHSLYRVGPAADWKIESTQAKWQHIALANDELSSENETVRTIRQLQRPIARARLMQQNAARYRQEYHATAVVVESQVARENRAIARLNDRITSVLGQTTAQQLGREPQAWWEWWQNFNEYYQPEERPVYEQNYVDYDHNYYPAQMMSCFAKGTPVWTKTGQRPIESLEMGDQVLAQNVDTGELTYKPVIGRTVRPPSEILNVKLGEKTVRTTRGHPFWVSGVGWRMAKELGDGAILHGVTGAARIESVEPSGEKEAYNLVVADFNTYFVGEMGLLVHDNTPRLPTRAMVPGVIED